MIGSTACASLMHELAALLQLSCTRSFCWSRTALGQTVVADSCTVDDVRGVVCGAQKMGSLAAKMKSHTGECATPAKRPALQGDHD